MKHNGVILSMSLSRQSVALVLTTTLTKQLRENTQKMQKLTPIQINWS